MYTAVLPYARRTVDGVEKYTYISEKYLTAESASAFSYLRILPVDFSGKFEQTGEISEQRLRELARQYIKNNGVGIPKINLTVRFVPLWQTKEYETIAPLERVNLCDTLTIRFLKLGIEASAKVIKTVYDVLKERYVSLTLGDAKSTFSKTIGSIQQDLTDTGNKISSIPSIIEQATNHVTELITGAKGGHALTIRDADGKPQAFAVMDTENVSTARRVWQWNLNGFGYSKNGINGPYETAITMDGTIVGKFIVGLTIVGSQIIAGVVQSANKAAWINLDTGEAHFEKGSVAAGMIKTGQLKSPDGTVLIDLSNGNFYVKKGSIIGNVITAGVIRSKDGTAWINLDTAEVHFEKGSVNANLLRAGKLISKDGETYFDLETGDLVAKKGRISGNIIKAGLIQSYNDNVYFDLEHGEICASQLVARDAGVYTKAKIGQGHYAGGEDFQGLQVFRYGNADASTPEGGALIGVHRANFGDSSYGLCDIASLGGLHLRAYVGRGDFSPSDMMAIQTEYRKFMKFVIGGKVAFYLDTNGNAYFGDIYMNGNIIDSDPDIKENIEEKAEKILPKIKRSRVYQYTLKPERTAGRRLARSMKAAASNDEIVLQDLECAPAQPSQRRRIGVMYDEVPEEIRRTTQDGRKGVDLYGMCSLLWKAVQELSDEVEDLKRKVKE